MITNNYNNPHNEIGEKSTEASILSIFFNEVFSILYTTEIAILKIMSIYIKFCKLILMKSIWNGAIIWRRINIQFFWII